MLLDEYQKQAMRTCVHPRGQGLHHALGWNALGLNGEAGEVADEIKKVIGHGHALDKDKLLKELGDVLWYIAALCNDLGADMSTVAAMNIEKLAKRYPQGFSQEKSQKREEKPAN